VKSKRIIDELQKREGIC